MTHPLAKPLQLPCGAELKNRLVKAAMSDSLGDGEGNPTQEQIKMYERWAEGGAGLSLIGEVQIGCDYPEKPGNLVLVPSLDKSRFETLARRGQKNGAHLWPQLGHAGALSHAPISQPKGPSPLSVEGLVCEGMSAREVAQLPARYARAATLAQALGFGGVQIHAGHGFLLSQFLSPLFNHRTDQFGGSIEGRFRVVGQIISAVRESVGDEFPVGIKINSTDQLEGGLTGRDALEVVRMLNRTSIDLIDVSGGTYFPGAKSSSDGASRGGAYFVEFARKARELTDIPIVVTGGVRTQVQAVDVLESHAADAVGLARAWVLNPDLANSWVGDHSEDPEFPRFDTPPAGGITAWYTMRISALAEGAEDTFDLDAHTALEIYETRDDERCLRWKQAFPDAS